MSITSNSSKVCRHLWIKRFCYDIIKVQHGRSVTVAAKQMNQSTHNNFLSTPSILSSVNNTKTIPNNNSLTQKTLQKAVSNHVKANQFNEARRLLTEYYNTTGHVPSIYSYNTIMKGLAKQFQYNYRQREAHALLDDMTKHGRLPTCDTYMQLLLGYAVHTNHISSTTTTTTTTTTSPSSTLEVLRKIKQLFHLFLKVEHQKGYKRTHFKIKKLIQVMSGSGHIAILPTMITALKAGIKLDIHVWNESLQGCVKGGFLDAGEQLLEIMRSSLQQQHSGIIPMPNAASYHIIISGYLGQGNKLNMASCNINMDKSVELFQKMMEDGIIADHHIYQSFIYAYASLSLSSSSSSEQLFKYNNNNNNNNNNNSSSSSSNNNSNNNNNNNNNTKDNPIETLQKLWQAMITTLTDDHKLDDHFLATLLDYYIKYEGYSAIEQVYWDLRYHKYKISRKLIGYFNNTIVACARQQHLMSSIAMFYDMLSLGFGANNRAVISLLHACIDRCQLDTSEQILQVMEETLQKPAPIHQYTVLIRGCVQQGQIEAANNIFIKLLQHYKQDRDNVALLSSAYTYMIQGYFKSNQINEAELLYQQYRQLQYELFLKKYKYKKNSEYKVKVKEADTFKKPLINAMIEGYGLLGQSEKLNEFIGQNYIEKFKDVETLATLIQAKLQYGDVKGAELHLEFAMKRYDVSDLHSSIEKVLASFALDGNISACEHWAKVLKSKNEKKKKITTATSSTTTTILVEALLVCYGQAGDFEKLNELYKEVNRDKNISLEAGVYNKINNEWLKNCT
ncbi:unnamed protein product [Cunninghamella echinulata]